MGFGMLGLGCEALNPPDHVDGSSDSKVVPDAPFDPNTGECATNWRVMDAADLARAKLENERLVMRNGGRDLKVQGLLGVPPGGRGAVLRFDFPVIDLGRDGELDVEMENADGTVARLVVQPEGAVLFVEAVPYGSNAELSFAGPPERMTFELELQGTGGVEARAFFFDAGRSKVLATSIPKLSGDTVTSMMTLKGSATEVQLERFARIDPGNGGLMEDFWCDSIGLAADRFRFPEGRASKAGNPCGDDDQCGAGELCRDNYCRRACLASSQCLSTVCLIDDEGGLCALSQDDCAPGDGTTCGADGLERMVCAGASDCPHDNDLCLGGACYSNDEPVSRNGNPWGTCPYARERCEDDRVEQCDTLGPGWKKLEQCRADQCKSTGIEAYCDACVRSCGGIHAEDVYASCDSAEAELDTDCRDAFEVCSTGDANDEPAHCRAIVTSEPATSPVQVGAGGNAWRIDPTEVTRAQYAAFLQKSPSIVSQAEDCLWNETYRPPDWPWFDSPERAVQADFCDAAAYCKSVGKELCSAQQWYDTCSAGGQNDFPYGDTFEAGACSIDPRRDVGTSPDCSTTPPFAGVYDMVGGVGEWTDSCQHGSTSVRAADSCRTRGTSASQDCSVERTVRRDSVAGIRCCEP